MCSSLLSHLEHGIGTSVIASEHFSEKRKKKKKKRVAKEKSALFFSLDNAP